MERVRDAGSNMKDKIMGKIRDHLTICMTTMIEDMRTHPIMMNMNGMLELDNSIQQKLNVAIERGKNLENRISELEEEVQDLKDLKGISRVYHS